VGRVIVYNGGTYDLLHPGHLYVFRQLRELAGPDGLVVIALNTDDFVARFKDHPPVQPYAEREAVLRGLRDIDEVVPNIGGADARPAIESVGPDIIAAGRDWWSVDDSRYFNQMGFDQAWLDEHGIRLVYLDWMDGHSSTNLRATARAMTR
jgi:glycerol-3-phosphate cytidylyltransferase